MSYAAVEVDPTVCCDIIIVDVPGWATRRCGSRFCSTSIVDTRMGAVICFGLLAALSREFCWRYKLRLVMQRVAKMVLAIDEGGAGSVECADSDGNE